MGGYEDRALARGRGDAPTGAGSSSTVPGKSTLTGQLPVQRKQSDAAQQAVSALAPGFGGAFPGASVHAGAEGNARAQAHGAPAVTEGSSIYLSTAVDLGSTGGRHVMAHEMAHVVQQTGAPTGRAGDGAAYERDANRVADTVAAGGTASPSLRTGQSMAQGYDSPEHQSMGNDVRSILNPVLAAAEDPLDEENACYDDSVGVCTADDPAPRTGGQSRTPMFGGVSDDEYAEAVNNDEAHMDIAHTGGLGWAQTVDTNARAAVPNLTRMLEEDPFIHERDRSLTISLRNYEMKQDVAGPYLAIQTDPVTGEAIRYEVPVSPGDLTALNGDLYGSMENMRKAPVQELVKLQRALDGEAAWEKQALAARANGKDPPPDVFDAQWSDVTAWRDQRVYDGTLSAPPLGDAAGGDNASYTGLALKNQAHFGEDTARKNEIEVQVNKGNLAAFDRGPQGNYADGNEAAWMAGHARALRLARESYDLVQHNAGAGGAGADHYGHETAAPKETGLSSPALSNSLAPSALGLDPMVPLRRDTGRVTPEGKKNDAYVENAGADHYLTDSFAAGHNIVRDTIGTVTDQFMQSHGGRDRFFEFVAQQLQEGAILDPVDPDPNENIADELKSFRDASKSGYPFMRHTAVGTGWLNSLGKDGMKQKLMEKVDGDMLHGIGAKLVHDYYNDHGLIVHNRKGMTFMTKGDGNVDQAPEARQIIALAVLESRTQITELATQGITPNPMSVWEYTPDFDKTAFTEENGPKILDLQFQDVKRLWQLIKDHFPPPVEKKTNTPADRVQELMQNPARMPADVGTPPTMQSWLGRRRKYVEQWGNNSGVWNQPGEAVPRTVDGKSLPAAPDRAYEEYVRENGPPPPPRKTLEDYQD